MKKIINGKLYNTETADLVASDRYWDGNNWERHGRNIFLYKTKKGSFFLHYTTLWQGEREQIEPISPGEAKEWYERLPVQETGYKEAFGIEPEEA